MVVHLTDAAVRAMQEMSWQLSACSTAAELEVFARQWLLRRGLPGEFCAFHDFTPTPERLRLAVYPNEDDAASVRQVVMNHLASGRSDHPLLQHYFSPPFPVTPLRLSDFFSDREVRDSAAYADVFRRWSIHYQLVLIHRRASGAGNGGGYALMRTDRDFTDEEVTLAIGLQPVLLALHVAVPGVAVQANDHADRAGLTSAELEVLNLLARGLSAVAISHVRRVSVRTVRKQLQAIYAKLGCHDRLLAVRTATRRGIIGNSDDMRRKPT